MTLPTDPGVIRQWEARVRRMVRHGENREQILYALSEANWPYDSALDLVRRMVARERWVAIGIMAATGLVGLLGLVITYFEFTAGFSSASSSSNSNASGSGIGCMIFGLIGFILGLVRLVKIRA